MRSPRRSSTLVHKLKNVFTSGIEFDTGEDGHVMTNIALVNGMSLLAVVVLLIFSVIYIQVMDKPYVALFELSLAVVVFLNMLALRFHRKVSVAGSVMLGCSMVLLVFLLITGGVDGTGPYWTLFFPLIAYHLCGRVSGSKWIFLFAGIYTAFLAGVFFDAFTVEYPDLALRNAFVLYLIIALLTYLYENKHERDGIRIRRQVEDLQRTERALAMARDEALEMARFRSQFLANMSHEIRTPMNAVVGMTELLLDTDLNEEQRQCTRIVHDAGNSLLGIINDILDLSKLESGMFHLAEEDFKLREMVEDVCDLMASQAHGKGLELICHVDENVPDAVEGDEGRLRQVLMNLVSNAIKFTPEGEIVVRLECVDAVMSDSVAVRLSVADTGIGMSETVREKLFTPFFQADSAMTRKHTGTGLGLALSQRLVELMGGDIEVHSESGNGSTFAVRVCLRRQPGVEATVVQAFPGVHVLVVDDNETNRMILRRQMSSLEMEVTTAASAAEALSILRHDVPGGRDYELIITDMQMPMMDGLSFASTVRKDVRFKAIPIIMLSSITWSTRDSRSQANVDGVLTKPVRFYKLVERVSHVLEACVGEVSKHRGVESGVEQAEVSAASVVESVATVLVAEDNRTNRKVIEKQLEKVGYACVFAKNGQEVLDVLAEHEFPAILMDCEMPEVDGFEACRRIRSGVAGEARKDVPVIAMTAHVMDEERRRCFEAGMNDYLPKPVKLEQLRMTLARWV